MNLLSNEYKKLTIINLETGEEIAVITNDEIVTNGTIGTKFTPSHDEGLAAFCDSIGKCHECLMKQAFPKCGTGWHVRYTEGKLNEAAHMIADAVRLIKEAGKNA